MKYFDKANDAMKPFCEYDSKYILYCIDNKNRTAGIEFMFNDNEETVLDHNIIKNALETAFLKHGLNKVYVNVIRDNYLLFHTLSDFNFIAESIHREQFFDTKPHDIVYMTVLRWNSISF